MSYIFHTPHQFILIDSTVKNGVFCQFFSSSYYPKPIQIHNQPALDYSAHMSTNGTLYVAVMTDAFHLNYYVYENNRFTRHTLVSNAASNYQLSSPVLYAFYDAPYLIYLSHQTHSTIYSFVQENLLHPQLTTLYTCTSEPQLAKSFITDSRVYIFFLTFDEAYHLNLLQLSPNEAYVSVVLSSPQPITDYSVCIEEEILHIAYVSELHGKYQLNYYNPQTSIITPLATTQYPSNPVIFCYYNLIWINAFINHKLQMLISIDDGEHFSIPTPCSMQNNIHRCHFLTQKVSPFVGQEIYASITSTLKLCTLAMIDIPHFHYDSVTPPELELLLEGLVLALSTSNSSVTQPQPPEIEAPSSLDLPKKPPKSTSNSTPPTSNSTYLEEATNAFMNELTGWDLPPKI